LTQGFALLGAAKVKPQNTAGVVFYKKLPILTSKLPPNLDAPIRGSLPNRLLDMLAD